MTSAIAASMVYETRDIRQQFTDWQARAGIVRWRLACVIPRYLDRAFTSAVRNARG